MNGERPCEPPGRRASLLVLLRVRSAWKEAEVDGFGCCTMCKCNQQRSPRSVSGYAVPPPPEVLLSCPVLCCDAMRHITTVPCGGTSRMPRSWTTNG